MRVAWSMLAVVLTGCVFFDEPDLHEGSDGDSTGRVDCFADLPEDAADELLPGPCEMLVDLYANGVTDSTWTFEYDDAGRETAQRVEGMIVRYAYDPAGNLELTTTDFEGDGEIDREERRDYACFEDEELPDPLPGPCSIVTDSDADGTRDLEQTFTYEEGRLVGERNVLAGRLVSLIAYEYDSEGRKVAAFTDTLGDGRVDSVTRFGYDSEGHLLYRRGDNVDDGTVDVSTEFTLDELGRPVVVEEFSMSRLTSTTRFEYDAEGRVVRETTTGANQSLGFVTEWRYDRAGNLLAEGHYDRSQQFDECRRYEYDCF